MALLTAVTLQKAMTNSPYYLRMLDGETWSVLIAVWILGFFNLKDADLLHWAAHSSKPKDKAGTWRQDYVIAGVWPYSTLFSTGYCSISAPSSSSCSKN